MPGHRGLQERPPRLVPPRGVLLPCAALLSNAVEHGPHELLDLGKLQGHGLQCCQQHLCGGGVGIEPAQSTASAGAPARCTLTLMEGRNGDVRDTNACKENE